MTNRAFQLRCERLEDRTTPSTVFATLNNRGTLLLTGSPGDDVLAVSQPSDGIIQVVGDANTPIQLGKNGAIIPAGTPAVFGAATLPVKNLAAKMGLGTDSFTVDLRTTAIHLVGNVTIDMGEGGTVATNQQLTVKDNLSGSAPNFLTVDGNFVARGGKGVDSYFLSEIVTGRNFRVTDKGGETSEIFLGSAPILASGDPLIGVAGNVTITTGAGAEDEIGLVGLDIQGKTNISTGTGDLITNQNAFVEFGWGFGQPSFFRSGLRIHSAPTNKGVDTISFDPNSKVTIDGSGLSISTYGGADVIQVDDVSVLGKTSINTGAGADQVALDGVNSTATFFQSVVLKTGAGKDSLHVGDSGPVKFLSALSANLGKDDDTLNLAATGLVTFTVGFTAIFDGEIGFNEKTLNVLNTTGPAQLLHFAM